MPSLDPDCPSGPATPGAGCDLQTDRRRFLRDGLLAVAALTSVAGSAAPLHALTRDFVEGLALDDGDVVSYALPATDGATIDKANRVILVRYRGMVHAFSLECPHKGTMVTWEPQQSRFFCPKHKSTFRPEGTRIQGKAPRNLDRHPVRLEGGRILVDRGVDIDSRKDAAGWNAAGVRVDGAVPPATP